MLAALVARATTGEGQRVEVPMFDAALAFNLVEHLSRAAVHGEPPGYNRVLSRHRGPHRTADGWVAMLPYTDAHWTALFQAVGEEQLLEQPWFADHRSRLVHADEVYGLLASIITRKTTAEWVALGTTLGIPVSPVPPLAEIVDDAANHRGVLQDADAPGHRAVSARSPRRSCSRRPGSGRSTRRRWSPSTPTRSWPSSATPNPTSPISSRPASSAVRPRADQPSPSASASASSSTSSRWCSISGAR